MKMLSIAAIVWLALGIATVTLAEPEEGSCGSDVMAFEDQFEKFLESVRTRDWDTFLGFLDPKGEMTAVLPDGKTYSGYDAFVASQKGYFSGTTGKFTYQVKKVTRSEGMAFGSIDATYEDVGADGVRFRLSLYISFLFRLDGDNWYLVHDQNTLKGRVTVPDAE